MVQMENWRKKTNNDGSIVFEYGYLLYRLYCVESEDNIDGMVPQAFFYGDSELPNPSFTAIKTIIKPDSLCGEDVVVCSVVEKCNDPECNDVVIINGQCYWKIL